jgi:hypothetical protein
MMSPSKRHTQLYAARDSLLRIARDERLATLTD